MNELLRAIGDFLATIVGAMGVVGRTRRRASIRADLDLLDKLEQHTAFGADSTVYAHLSGRVSDDVARLAGVKERKTPVASIVLALGFTVGFGYWTYTMVDEGFVWYSVFPGTIAFLMFVSVFGMLFPDEADAG